MIETLPQFVQRHWLALAFAIPVVVYAGWVALMVAPEIVKTVVPAVVRAVAGS